MPRADVDHEREYERQEEKKRWEFSKKLTFIFLVIFSIHLSAFLISAMLSIGNCLIIKDSFHGSLPFYGVIFTGYTAKATFENYDKFRKQYEQARKKIEIDGESTPSSSSSLG